MCNCTYRLYNPNFNFKSTQNKHPECLNELPLLVCIKLRTKNYKNHIQLSGHQQKHGTNTLI